MVDKCVDQLPVTGGGSMMLVIAACAAIIGGIVIVWSGRRREISVAAVVGAVALVAMLSSSATTVDAGSAQTCPPPTSAGTDGSTPGPVTSAVPDTSVVEPTTPTTGAPATTDPTTTSPATTTTTTTTEPPCVAATLGALALETDVSGSSPVVRLTSASVAAVAEFLAATTTEPTTLALSSTTFTIDTAAGGRIVEFSDESQFVDFSHSHLTAIPGASLSPSGVVEIGSVSGIEFEYFQVVLPQAVAAAGAQTGFEIPSARDHIPPTGTVTIVLRSFDGCEQQTHTLSTWHPVQMPI